MLGMIVQDSYGERVALKRFDPDRALDRAIDAFWLEGYEATSAEDLVRAMGINRGSLYATFGSKAELYRRALERYASRTCGELRAGLEADGPVLPALRAALHEQARELASDPQRRGCLLTNACSEGAAQDPVVGAVVREALDETRALLAATISRGQSSGELPSCAGPDELADLVLTTMHGLRVLARAGQDLPRLLASVELTLVLLRSDAC